MKITYCDISNLEDIFYYYRNMKSENAFPVGTSNHSIFNSAKITMSIEDITAIEAIRLREISDQCNVEKSSDIITDYESLGFSEDIWQSLEEMKKFLDLVEHDEQFVVDRKYEFISQRHYSCTLFFNGISLLSLLGSNTEAVFYKDNNTKELFDAYTEETYQGMIENFVNLFANEFYSALFAKLDTEDLFVRDLISDKYCSRLNGRFSKLVRIVCPFGGNIKFVPDEDELVENEKGMTALKQNFESNQDKIDLYFVVNSSFYSFMQLILRHPEVEVFTDSFKNQLLTSESFFLDAEISEKYQKRFGSLFEPILQWKAYVGNSKEYNTFFKLTMVPENTNFTYVVKIKWEDVSGIVIKDEPLNEELQEIKDSINEEYSTLSRILSK